jgi:TonB-dependent SusC/RagA subfamily outer membrane receptor
MKIKLILLLIVSFAIIPDLPAQKSGKKIIVTGKVLDAYKGPIANAMVMVDGKDSGRKTDADGNYRIKIKPTVSKIGVFTTITGIVEETVNGRNTINFTLEKFIPSDSGAERPLPEEEVVDAGYSVSRKKDLTKPVSKADVSGKQYTTFTSIYDMLQTISGVYVSGSNVTIRGTSTTGNSSPLFVVNGSVVSSISGIDPSTVSTIEVLKGPAASIYGMQGANGVILIKLK